MSYADNMQTLSNINCGLASAVTYLQQRNNGVNPQYAMLNLSNNLMNGLARNEVAYQMQKCGNPMGNTINMYAGYGNPVSNAIGTMGLMSVCNPWMFFNSPSYMFTPMPMGTFSSMGMGFNYGAYHHHHGYYC